MVVPATSANLGCAFDCGGLALKIYLRALFIPSVTAALSLEYQGKTPERFPMKSSNLILHALRFAAERLGAPPPAGHVAVESEIPISVGLGSSAAAVIAGLLLGVQHSGKEVAPEAFCAGQKRSKATSTTPQPLTMAVLFWRFPTTLTSSSGEDQLSREHSAW